MALRGFGDKEKAKAAGEAEARAKVDAEKAAVAAAMKAEREREAEVAAEKERLRREAEDRVAVEAYNARSRNAEHDALRREFTKAAFTGIIARGEGGTGWLGKDEWPGMAIEMGRKMTEAWERDLAPKQEPPGGR